MELPAQLKEKGIRFVLLEKGGKKPFQKDWTNKNIEYDNPELLEHLSKDGNYGVMGGGEKNLVIVDFDNEAVQTSVLKQLPETFTVKTGSGLLHLYYFVEVPPVSFKGFDEDMNTLFDVQGEGKQVVGPGCLHPNGNHYEVIKNVPIQTIAFAEIKANLMPFDKKPKKEEQKLEPKRYEHIEENFIDDIKRKISVGEVLRYLGIDTSRNPTGCPFHSSKGGKCLGFNNDTAHCFHCDGSWNIFTLITESKKCEFKEALDILAKIGGMEKELDTSRRKYIEKMVAVDEDEATLLRAQFAGLTAGKDKKWGEASELLTDYVRRKMSIYTTKDDEKSEVWIYKDGIYIPQGRSEVKELLRKVLKDLYSAYVYNLVMNKIEPDTFIDINKFFATSYPGLVPVQNGILNIYTRDVEDFTPEKIFFNKMPVTYDETKKCPKIDLFLSQILAKAEDKKVFYEILGFALLDEYKYEKAFMYHGGGRNGKGRAIALKKKLFGVENCCAIQLSSLTSENFDISELFGKRLNLAGDIGSQDLKETNMFKSLTGRDVVSAKRKFLRNLHFQNNAKFIFACNELPMVYDMTKGFWDRWILLDFPYTFVTQEEYTSTEDKRFLKIKDEDILTKISEPDELSGLLNEAIAGLYRLLSNHKFSTTEGSEEVKQRWIRRSNSFIAFCLDKIEDNFDGRVPKKILRKKYADYCKEHKISPKSDFVIKKHLVEAYGATEVRGGYNEEFNNMRNDYWEGIKWK